jgi:hypothetical protein
VIGWELKEYLTKTEFWPYENARQFVHSLGLKSVAEWDQYRRSGNRPDYIPSTPRRTYKNKGWVNWADGLGRSTVAP